MFKAIPRKANGAVKAELDYSSGICYNECRYVPM